MQAYLQEHPNTVPEAVEGEAVAAEWDYQTEEHILISKIYKN